jgi:hypothetical protein
MRVAISFGTLILLVCASGSSSAFLGAEHKAAGDAGAKAAFGAGGEVALPLRGRDGTTLLSVDGRLYLANGVTATFGDLVAVYGDWRESVETLLATSPGTMTDVIRQAGGENTQSLGAFLRHEPILRTTLALQNQTHFSGVAALAYAAEHREALSLAAQAAKSEDAQKLWLALHHEAMACHSLTDLFAAGHNFSDRRRSVAALRAGVSEIRHLGVKELLSGLKDVTWALLGNFVAAHIHDQVNQRGVELRNLQGTVWRAFGDGRYAAQDAAAQSLPQRAVEVSLRSLLAAHRQLRLAAKEPGFEQKVYALLRDPKSYEALMLVPVAFRRGSVTDIVGREKKVCPGDAFCCLMHRDVVLDVLSRKVAADCGPAPDWSDYASGTPAEMVRWAAGAVRNAVRDTLGKVGRFFEGLFAKLGAFAKAVVHRLHRTATCLDEHVPPLARQMADGFVAEARARLQAAREKGAPVLDTLPETERAQAAKELEAEVDRALAPEEADVIRRGQDTVATWFTKKGAKEDAAKRFASVFASETKRLRSAVAAAPAAAKSPTCQDRCDAEHPRTLLDAPGRLACRTKCGFDSLKEKVVDWYERTFLIDEMAPAAQADPGDFQPVGGLDPSLIESVRSLLRHAEWAYRKAAKLKDGLGASGFGLVGNDVLRVEGLGARAYAAVKGNKLVFSFRGSMARNLLIYAGNLLILNGVPRLVDADFLFGGDKAARYRGKGLQVHWGYRDAYLKLRDRLLAIARAHADKEIYVTGHSLGAALASLFAFDLKVSLGRGAHSVFFGTPRIGNRAFAKAFAAEVPQALRVVNHADYATAMPPLSRQLGYVHAGRVLHVDHDGQIITTAARLSEVVKSLSLKDHMTNHYGDTLLKVRDVCAAKPAACRAPSTGDPLLESARQEAAVFDSP